MQHKGIRATVVLGTVFSILIRIMAMAHSRYLNLLEHPLAFHILQHPGLSLIVEAPISQEPSETLSRVRCSSEALACGVLETTRGWHRP